MRPRARLGRLGLAGVHAVPPSNPEIARELVVGVDAVKSILRALFERFALADLPQNRKRAALVRRAPELGVITPADLRRPPASG